jgi:hypothetical protein
VTDYTEDIALGYLCFNALDGVALTNHLRNIVVLRQGVSVIEF